MIMKTGFFVGLMVLLLLAACTQAAATPDPGVDSDEETSILEEGGNINLAQHLAAELGCEYVRNDYYYWADVQYWQVLKENFPRRRGLVTIHDSSLG